jgi:U3 small nucleolar RNA-associated protein 11
LSQEEVALLKTQDAGYLRTMLGKIRKEREALERSIVLGSEGVVSAKDELEGKRGNGKGHFVFVSDRVEQKSFVPEEFFGVESKEVNRKWNRRRKSDMDGGEDGGNAKTEEPNDTDAGEEQDGGSEDEEIAYDESRRAKLQRQLAAVRRKEEALRTAERELGLQRAKMAGLIGGVNKDGVKYKIRNRRR